MAPRFTILLPVHRPPAMLPYAIETVLGQSHADYELFVICDGAPAETVACARTFAAHDPRIRVFDLPKGERHGEAHRHTALAQARGDYVAGIADDDLWLPDHLAQLAELLREVDFGNLLHVIVMPDGAIRVRTEDLADARMRRQMLAKPWNFFGPTVAGHRLSAYRNLPEGWTPAPADMLSDLWMWRKFLGRDELSFGTRFAIESLHFATPMRSEMSMEERAAENRRWFERIRDPNGLRTLKAEIVKDLCGQLRTAGEKVGELSAARKKLRARVEELETQNAALHAKLAAGAGRCAATDR